MKMEKARVNRWDFYKGLLMLSVVWGHTITALKAGALDSMGILVFLRTFDMPMFAFITGYFLKKSCEKRSWHENIINKIGVILCPVIIWNLLYNVLVGSLSLNVGRFWFLWSIFFVSCIVIIIDSALKGHNYLKLISYALSVIVFHTAINDKWNIGFLLLPCIIGYYYSENIHKWSEIPGNKKHILNTVVIIVFIICQFFWKIQYNVWNTGCNIWVFGTPLQTALRISFRGCIGIFGCFAMKQVFDWIYMVLSRRNKMLNIIQRGCVFLGKNTLQIYILQTLLVEDYGGRVVSKIVEAAGFNPFMFNKYILGWIVAPCVAIAALIVMAGMITVIKSVPFIREWIYGISLVKMKTLIYREGK